MARSEAAAVGRAEREFSLLLPCCLNPPRLEKHSRPCTTVRLTRHLCLRLRLHEVVDRQIVDLGSHYEVILGYAVSRMCPQLQGQFVPALRTRRVLTSADAAHVSCNCSWPFTVLTFPKLYLLENHGRQGDGCNASHHLAHIKKESLHWCCARCIWRSCARDDGAACCSP